MTLGREPHLSHLAHHHIIVDGCCVHLLLFCLPAKAKGLELQISSVKFEDVGGNDTTLKVSSESEFLPQMGILQIRYSNKAFVFVSNRN